MLKNPVGQHEVRGTYSHAANSLLSTINFNLEDIRQWAILDSGATSHFLIPEAPTKNVQPATNPLKVTMPDGNSVYSTHICELDLPQLPKNACQGHIIPGLSRTLPPFRHKIMQCRMQSSTHRQWCHSNIQGGNSTEGQKMHQQWLTMVCETTRCSTGLEGIVVAKKLHPTSGQWGI